MVIAVCFCGTRSAIQACSPPEAGKTMKTMPYCGLFPRGNSTETAANAIKIMRSENDYCFRCKLTIRRSDALQER